MDLFNLIQMKLGAPIKHRVINEPTLEIANQYMDASLIISKTNWRPNFTLESSIGEIVKWYLDNI